MKKLEETRIGVIAIKILAAMFLGFIVGFITLAPPDVVFRVLNVLLWAWPSALAIFFILVVYEMHIEPWLRRRYGSNATDNDTGDFDVHPVETPGWEGITIVTDDGIRRTLRIDGRDVRFSITTGNPQGKGLHFSGEKAISEWLATDGLEDIYPGIAAIVHQWHTNAIAATF